MERNLIIIADEIIKVISENCKDERKDIIIRDIESVKESYRYKAPEMTYISWNELANVLNNHLNVGGSEWENEINKIFSGDRGI